MKPKTLILTLAVGALLGSAQARAATVLFSSFDMDAAGWQPSFGGGTLSWDAADELGGSGSAKLTDIPSSTLAAVLSPCVAVTPGQTVTFGGAVKAVGGGTRARVAVHFSDGPGCITSFGPVTGDLESSFPSSTWQPVQGTAVVPAGATFARLWIWLTTGNPAPSAFSVDNAFLITDATCVGTATAGCLNKDRFRLSASWTKPDGQKGAARFVKLTDDSAYLWFFKESNIEVVAKVLDACSLNDRFWVFAAGLTNVEVSLRVTDTVTGEVWESENPLGQAFEPIQDTGALEACTD